MAIVKHHDNSGVTKGRGAGQYVSLPQMISSSCCPTPLNEMCCVQKQKTLRQAPVHLNWIPCTLPIPAHFFNVWECHCTITAYYVKDHQTLPPLHPLTPDICQPVRQPSYKLNFRSVFYPTTQPPPHNPHCQVIMPLHQLVETMPRLYSQQVTSNLQRLNTCMYVCMYI